MASISGRVMLAALAATLLLASCSATATPAPTISATDAFVAELTAAGLAARSEGPFSTVPIGGTGTLVCAGSEAIQVYEFDSAAAREAAASQINRGDPAVVGNAVVDWIGQPHFWQRDRLIVLSVGGSSSVVATLTSVLGQPFAQGPPGGQPSHDGCS